MYSWYVKKNFKEKKLLLENYNDLLNFIYFIKVLIVNNINFRL
jgi:hypothetical protein